MAVRLELVAVDGGGEAFLGYASASDADETLVLQVLQVIADDIPELSAPQPTDDRRWRRSVTRNRVTRHRQL